MSRRYLIWGSVLLLTLLLAYDFFPKFNEILNIPKSILIGMMVMILVVGFFSRITQKDNSPETDFRWQIGMSLYVLLLIIVFTLFGGRSQVGLSLSNPIVWILFVISMIDSMKSYKKVKGTANSAVHSEKV